MVSEPLHHEPEGEEFNVLSTIHPCVAQCRLALAGSSFDDRKFAFFGIYNVYSASPYGQCMAARLHKCRALRGTAHD